MLTILAGFVCAFMTAFAFSADGPINLDGGEVNRAEQQKHRYREPEHGAAG